MHSTYNKGKSVVAEGFIRTLERNIYKYRTSISKNECIDILDDIANEHDNTYHRDIKIKLVDAEDIAYINVDKEVQSLNFKLVIM